MSESGRLGFKELTVRLESRTVLHRITLDFDENTTTVLMGPGGSGKSTLAGFLVGRLPEASKIELSGATYRPAPKSIAWLPQRVARVARSAADILGEYTTAPLKDEALSLWRTHLEREGLHELVTYLDSEEQLSVPEMQTLRLAAARRQRPALMVIDEPCAGMFHGTDEMVLRYLEQIHGEQTIVMLTHHQARCRRLADNVVLMAAGQVIEVAPTRTFFENPASPHTRHYLRTGGCSVVSADANVMLSPEADRERNAAYTAEQAIVSTSDTPTAEQAHGSETAGMPVSGEVDELVTEAPVATATVSLVTPSPGRSTIEPSVTRVEALAEGTEARVLPRARGPEGFYWLVADELAGCPMPGIVEPIERDLDRLARAGVRVLITLQTRALNIPEGAEASIPHVLHFPIKDMHAPEPQETIAFCRKVEEYVHRGDPVAYHCRAGLGRTGTMLVSHLIGRGMEPHDALMYARAINGRWVQSEEQEAFLHALSPGFLLSP